MPSTLSYPGVYVEEIPSGVRTITGVATSITAFVGRAKRGPVNEAVTINNYGDYERVFGGLDLNSTMSYAVRDFYLNGGSQAVIVRLYHEDVSGNFENEEAFEKAKQGGQAIAAAVSTAIDAGGDISVQFKKAIDNANTAQQIIAGENDSVKLKGANKVLTAVTKSADTALETLKREAEGAIPSDSGLAQEGGQAIATAVSTAINANGTISEKFKKAIDDANTAQQTIAGENDSVKLKGANMVLAAVTKFANDAPVILRMEAANSIPSLLAARTNFSVGPHVHLKAVSQGSWGASLRATVESVKGKTAEDVANRLGLTNNGKIFNLVIKDVSPGGTTEKHINLTFEKSTRQVDNVLKAESKLVLWKGSDLPVSVAELPNITLPESSLDDDVTTLEKEIKKVKLANPDEDTSIKEDELKAAKNSLKASDGKNLGIDDFTGNEKQKEGIYALEDVDLFNLLCLPPYLGADAAGKPNDVEKSLIAQADAYCIKRRAVLLVDPPSNWTDKTKVFNDPSKETNNLDKFARSRNAALFFPRLKHPNPLRNNQVEEFVPCGAIAGIISRTDAERGIWKAPAGIDATLRGVPELSVKLTDDENGELNPKGVNCLRSFPNIGRVVWGARTLRGADNLADEYKYLPVRRLALFIEESLFLGTQWVVFEPNDEPLWSQIRMNVGSFMHTLFHQGAFQGSSPKQAYFVKCDKETTPQSDIDRGIVNIAVGFAPLKPAEFVVIKLQQIAGDLEF